VPGGILVPLDGSEMAEQALAVGASRVRKSGGDLHLVSVHEPMPLAGMPPDFPGLMPDLEEPTRANLAEYLESVAAVARASLATPVITSVVTGAAAAALCEYVESHSVGLVVMTTHGPRCWWRRSGSGDTATAPRHDASL